MKILFNQKGILLTPNSKQENLYSNQPLNKQIEKALEKIHLCSIHFSYQTLKPIENNYFLYENFP
jgi:hypothetical protein